MYTYIYKSICAMLLLIEKKHALLGKAARLYYSYL